MAAATASDDGDGNGDGDGGGCLGANSHKFLMTYVMVKYNT